MVRKIHVVVAWSTCAGRAGNQRLPDDRISGPAASAQDAVMLYREMQR